MIWICDRGDGKVFSLVHTAPGEIENGSFTLKAHQMFSVQTKAEEFTAVFVDTRLWKTKHSRKRFQNFRQS